MNQIEIGREYAFVSVSIPDGRTIRPAGYLGVDRNTTGHIAVMGDPLTGKVWKLGKSGEHTHKKYRDMRRNLQKGGQYKKIKRMKGREKRKVRDLNHRTSKKIVSVAGENGMGIKLEMLKGIRNARSGKRFRYSLNSWNFYQLQQMIEYKARLLGIPVEYVDPHDTSRKCSRCGLIGHRSGKYFECSCGHVEHADVNASFNIAMAESIEGIVQLRAERDVRKGNTDIPREATP